MKRTLAVWFAALVLVAATALPAAARDLPPGGLTADEVAAWLQESSYPATVKTNPTDSSRQIVSSTIDGINYDIYLYECEQLRCRSMQYAAGWNNAKISVDAINKWNGSRRWCRAYLGSDGAAWCEYDIAIAPGGTYEMLGQTLAHWREIIALFRGIL